MGLSKPKEPYEAVGRGAPAAEAFSGDRSSNRSDHAVRRRTDRRGHHRRTRSNQSCPRLVWQSMRRLGQDSCRAACIRLADATAFFPASRLSRSRHRSSDAYAILTSPRRIAPFDRPPACFHDGNDARHDCLLCGMIVTYRNPSRRPWRRSTLRASLGHAGRRGQLYRCVLGHLSNRLRPSRRSRGCFYLDLLLRPLRFRCFRQGDC